MIAEEFVPSCWYVSHHKLAVQPFQYLFLIQSHGFSSPLLNVSLLQLLAGIHHPSGSYLTSPHLENNKDYITLAQH